MEIDREWEKFTGGPFVPHSERLYVTLSGKGKLLLNRKAYSVIGNPKRVLLYFNRKTDSIGIRPAHERLAEAFPARVTGGSVVFYVGSFLRHFGIKLQSTEKFVAPDLDANGLLRLDLSNTITVGGWQRRIKSKNN
ncbi:MAG: hypothetical protein ABL959_06720 [Pyrinomonadaceae bacterium]